MDRDTKINIYKEIVGEKHLKKNNNLEITKLPRNIDIGISKMRRNLLCEKCGKEQSKPYLQRVSCMKEPVM